MPHRGCRRLGLQPPEPPRPGPFLAVGASGQRSLGVDPDRVLFQKPSKHKKKKHKKEKEERSKDKKKPKKKKSASDGAAEPVENGALDEDPLPVRGTALASRGAGAPRSWAEARSRGQRGLGGRGWVSPGGSGVREAVLSCGRSP